MRSLVTITIISRIVCVALISQDRSSHVVQVLLSISGLALNQMELG